MFLVSAETSSDRTLLLCISCFNAVFAVIFQDVKQQVRMKRKELNCLLGFAIGRLKDKVGRLDCSATLRDDGPAVLD